MPQLLATVAACCTLTLGVSMLAAWAYGSLGAALTAIAG